MPTEKATAKSPSRPENIPFHEFCGRLGMALQNYIEYCKVTDFTEARMPLILWLEHYQEFLSVEELEKR